jgi:uncharacterized protein YdeI (YjbR/CyaY-like superfamily)
MIPKELWVGFYKKDTGLPSLTWPESVDQALCFGWIDGLRKSIDEKSYKIRFTPRKPDSNWSKVNIEKVAELTRLGLMRPEGLKAFGLRKEEKSGIYTSEQRHLAQLDEAALAQFQAHPKAWEFFQNQPNSYRVAAVYWVVSAKKEETRQSRLARLIEDSDNGRTVPPLAQQGK